MFWSDYTKFQYLAVNSVYLMARLHENKLHKLYACDNFYLEICYDETGSGIESMRTFQNREHLESYLNRIEIPN